MLVTMSVVQFLWIQGKLMKNGKKHYLHKKFPKSIIKKSKALKTFNPDKKNFYLKKYFMQKKTIRHLKKIEILRSITSLDGQISSFNIFRKYV
jgi:hypothetical protein